MAQRARGWISTTMSASRKGDRPTAIGTSAEHAMRNFSSHRARKRQIRSSRNGALAQDRVKTYASRPQPRRERCAAAASGAPTIVYCNAFAPDSGELPAQIKFNTGSALIFNKCRAIRQTEILFVVPGAALLSARKQRRSKMCE